jgi:hypothetical protein
VEVAAAMKPQQETAAPVAEMGVTALTPPAPELLGKEITAQMQRLEVAVAAAGEVRQGTPTASV